MIAVFQKELRDCLRWTPLGMVLGLVMLWLGLPKGVYSATQVELSLMLQLGLAACLIAIAMGLLQSLSDIRNDSRAYLLHRPIKPSKIFWAKVAAGYVAYMLTLAVPVVVAMIYLQAKGIERLPTNALQVVPFLLYSCVVFLLHPTVLWIASRDARWVGTRLLPAVGVIAVVWVGLSFFQIVHQNVYWTITVLIGILFVFVSVTLLSARHAFVHQSKLPARSSANWRSVPCMVGLVFSGVVLYAVVFAFVASSSMSTALSDSRTYQLSLNDQGQWQQLQIKRTLENWHEIQVLARGIDGEGEFEKVDEDWKAMHGSTLSIDNHLIHGNPLEQFAYLGRSESKTAKRGQVTMVGHRGRLLLYDGSEKLISIITPSESFNAWDEAKGRFAGLRSLSWLHSGGHTYLGGNLQATSNPLLICDDGLYQLIADERRVELLSNDGKVNGAMLLLQEGDTPASLWTLCESKLIRHEVASADSSVPMPQADSPTIKLTDQLELPPIKVLNSQSWDIGQLNDNETLHVLRTPAGQHAMVRQNYLTSVSQYAMLGDSGSVEVLESVQLPTADNGQSESWVGWTIPPVFLICVTAFTSVFYGAEWPLGMIFASTCHGVLAAIVAWWLGGVYGMSSRERKAWTIAGLLLGFGTLIGIVSIYRKHIMAECPRCSKERRIDLESCEHCDQLWDPPQEEGIEIFEHDRSSRQLEAASLG